MKNNCNGQAAVLTSDQLQELFSILSPKYRALFGICFFTGCRISEALQLQRSDLVGDRIVFRASTTKGKKTREVAINPQLRSLLEDAYGLPEAGYLFPGRSGGHMNSQAADLVLRQAADYIGLQGISTHSFRRSALTHLAASGGALKQPF